MTALRDRHKAPANNELHLTSAAQAMDTRR